MKLNLQGVTAESLSVARAQIVNWDTVGTFLIVLEKVSNGNNLSGTSSNVKEFGTKLNSPDTVITDEGPKYTHVLSPGVNSEYITVIARCEPSDQFLLLDRLFKDVNKKRNLAMVCS